VLAGLNATPAAAAAALVGSVSAAVVPCTTSACPAGTLTWVLWSRNELRLIAQLADSHGHALTLSCVRLLAHCMWGSMQKAHTQGKIQHPVTVTVSAACARQVQNAGRIGTHGRPADSCKRGVARVPPVYSMAGLPSVSTVAQPLKQPSASCQPGSGLSAGGCCRQCSRSVEVAWPQDRPQDHWVLSSTF
jgi:hypothetical protein